MLFLMKYFLVHSQPYAEAMAMSTTVSYTPCDKSSKEKSGDIIMLVKFEGGDLWYKTRDNAEKGDKSDYDSIMPPLISEEEMDVMDSGDESED